MLLLCLWCVNQGRIYTFQLLCCILQTLNPQERLSERQRQTLHDVITIWRMIIKLQYYIKFWSSMKITLLYALYQSPKMHLYSIHFVLLSFTVMFRNCTKIIYCCWNKHGRWINVEHRLTIIKSISEMQRQKAKSTVIPKAILYQKIQIQSVDLNLPCGRLTLRLQGTEDANKKHFGLVFILQQLVWQSNNNWDLLMTFERVHKMQPSAQLQCVFLYRIFYTFFIW